MNNSLPSPEIRLFDALVLLEDRAGPARDDRARLQHVAAARRFERVAGVLLHQQDARPGGVGGADAAEDVLHHERREAERGLDRKSTRLNSSHVSISYAVFCLKKKKQRYPRQAVRQAPVRSAPQSNTATGLGA